MTGATGSISAHTVPGESGGDALHADTVESFTDMNLDVPFEYGDAIYDAERGHVRIPRAVGPNGKDADGFRVYCHTYEVRETSHEELKITDSGGPGMSGVSMKLLLILLDEESTRIVNADRVKA